MDTRKITDKYFVSPQISPEDAATLHEAGFRLVICNRPDGENPPELWAEAIGAAVTDAGMEFAVLPLTHQTMNAENILRQSELVAAADGPVLAYCASGTRCSVIWALGNAAKLGADAVLEATAEAGYDLSGLRPTLETLAE
ncbi:TIGR01244 family sulfur transferase [Tropicibacter naphthalenivorans]|uniref:Beta-lactamase hydrolase-like protein n=1 Tax=Tropicibacter naphthalenivorans TaxID=441103 RepID=A0A0P1GKC5_9RHOB|nr:TIGR01244 family sulfur transferase [Tropicibacter naphthalenivorans]CUH82648.1 Beta-lactamase hydrolase-like protein [Tropicibacter naphthalenivorans]SMD10146.1 TIGR01244 family protein [Tropicibacter naphthalenivorans]